MDWKPKIGRQGMIEQLKGKSDGVEMGLLLAGIVTVLVAYFLPAVTFSGQRGAAVYGLSIFSKLPIMSALAFAAMAAACAAVRLGPSPFAPPAAPRTISTSPFWSSSLKR